MSSTFNRLLEKWMQSTGGGGRVFPDSVFPKCALTALLFSIGGGSASAVEIIGGNPGTYETKDVPGTWNSGDLIIGNFGWGNLVIGPSGYVDSYQVFLGQAAGSRGTARILGTWWTSPFAMYVGVGGEGTLTIEDGGHVLTSGVVFGVEGSGSGTFLLNGGTLTTASIAKGSGTASLRFNGGTVRAGQDRSNFFANFAAGDVTLAAGGLKLDTNGYTVGINTPLSGEGGLTKLNSGTLSLSGNSSYEGMTSVRGGALEVWGSITSAGSMVVGQESGDAGLLGIPLGGTVSNPVGYLGYDLDSSGSATVNGVWENAGALHVGYQGSGLLNISLRGIVSNATGYLGYDSGSSGIANVSGVWENADALHIGYQGSGLLNIEPGGQVFSTAANLGTWSGSSGTVNVSGTWTISGDLTFGVSGWRNTDHGDVRDSGGTAILNIENGGHVSAAETVLLDGEGSLNLGGILTTGGIARTTTGGNWSVKLDGGTLQATRDNNEFFSGAWGSLTLTEKGFTFDTNGHAIGLSSLSGLGRLAKAGAGDLTFSNTNTYLGGTAVYEGTLIARPDSTISHPAGDMVVGQFSGGEGTLQIAQMANLYGDFYESGAVVTNRNGYLGINAGSVGNAIVGGTWTNLGNLYVGYWGTGTLEIEESKPLAHLTAPAGKVVDEEAYLGFQAGGNGTATVRGIWENSEALYVGYLGTGILNVEPSGFVSSPNGYLGLGAGSVGTTTVRGVWTLSEDLVLGGSGSGTLNIAGGATVNAAGLVLGAESGGVGALNLGSGATLVTGGLVKGNGAASVTFSGGWVRATGDNNDFFSNFAAGELRSTGGLRFDTNGYDVGISSPISGPSWIEKNGSGTLTLSGDHGFSGAGVPAGTLAVMGSMNGNIWVGGARQNNATLIVGPEGHITSAEFVDSSSSIHGKIIVQGTLDFLASSIGTYGSAHLVIEKDGHVMGAGSGLGIFAGSEGAADVSGTWEPPTEFSQAFNIGYSGSGTLNIHQGGAVRSSLTYVGRNAGSYGVMNVNGVFGYPEFPYLSTLSIGDSGFGRLSIGSDGSVHDQYGYAAVRPGSSAEVFVSGLWASSETSIGLQGTSTLQILRSGHVSSYTSYVGKSQGGVGYALVSGTWTAGYLSVGYLGTGTVTIYQGGLVTGSGALGGVSGVQGTATVRGTWSGGTVEVGVSGRGFLHIEDGGVVDVTTLRMAAYPGSNGIAYVNSGGTLLTAGLVAGEGNHDLNFDGGTLRARADNENFFSNFGNYGAFILGGGMTFDTDVYNIGVATEFWGTGPLTKTGSGALTLSGPNRHGGAVVVDEGLLKVNGSLNSSSITVNAGGVLGGDGSVRDVILQPEGIVSPGDGIGTLSTGNQTWSGGAGYVWELNSATGTAGANWDSLNITGTLTLDSITAGAPFTITITSLGADNHAGAAENFNPAQSYTWILVSAGGGISGFSADKFAIDSSAFENAPNSNRFSLGSDGTHLTLTYSAVPEPSTWAIAITALLGGLALRRRYSLRRNL